MHAHEAVLDRLELAIADVQAADTNGVRPARVDLMVEQALDDYADIDSPVSPAPSADNEDAAADESLGENFASTNAPGVFHKLGSASSAAHSIADELIDPYTLWMTRHVTIADHVGKIVAILVLSAVIRNAIRHGAQSCSTRVQRRSAVAESANKNLQ
jgi:hypothetical protein